MTCGWCNTQLPNDAVFCSECGRSVTTARNGNTRELLDRATATESSGDADAAFSPSPLGSEIARPCRQCGAELAASDIVCAACEYPVNAPAESRRAITAPIEPMPDLFSPFDGGPPVRSIRPPNDGEVDVEDTRITRSRRSGERFVLQFSTGESVAVYGSGLIGRNPRSEPSEYVDQFVRVTDPTRSVSKTHLEFGQDSGAFWVRDRFSGNGSIVREPERQPARCEPGRRYLVPRGTRVDLGDQFFVVS